MLPPGAWPRSRCWFSACFVDRRSRLLSCVAFLPVVSLINRWRIKWLAWRSEERRNIHAEEDAGHAGSPAAVRVLALLLLPLSHSLSHTLSLLSLPGRPRWTLLEACVCVSRCWCCRLTPVVVHQQRVPWPEQDGLRSDESTDTYLANTTPRSRAVSTPSFPPGDAQMAHLQ